MLKAKRPWYSVDQSCRPGFCRAMSFVMDGGVVVFCIIPGLWRLGMGIGAGRLLCAISWWMLEPDDPGPALTEVSRWLGRVVPLAMALVMALQMTWIIQPRELFWGFACGCQLAACKFDLERWCEVRSGKAPAWLGLPMTIGSCSLQCLLIWLVGR